MSGPYWATLEVLGDRELYVVGLPMSNGDGAGGVGVSSTKEDGDDGPLNLEANPAIPGTYKRPSVVPGTYKRPSVVSGTYKRPI